MLAVAAEGGARQLGSGCRAVREGALVALVPPDPIEPPPAQALPVPGSVDFGPWHRITARVAEPPPRVRPLGRSRALLGFDVVGPRIEVRVAEPGERIELTKGSKSVRDALAEHGVPQRMRATWPVVAAHGKIAWVAGVRVAAGARAQADTRRTLEIGWERTGR